MISLAFPVLLVAALAALPRQRVEAIGDVGLRHPWAIALVAGLSTVLFAGGQLMPGALVLHAGAWLVMRQLESLPGIRLLLVGLLANFLVVAVNGAMPVWPSAIEALGASQAVVTGSARHVLAGDATLFVFLGDAIPVPGARLVVSIGDLAMLAGASLALQRVLASHLHAKPSQVVTNF